MSTTWVGGWYCWVLYIAVFLPTHSINSWEWHVDISKYNFVFVCFVLSVLSIFALYIWKVYHLVHTHLGLYFFLVNSPFYHYLMPFISGKCFSTYIVPILYNVPILILIYLLQFFLNYLHDLSFFYCPFTYLY